ncbi:hypothetical protein TNCV_66881 [Trichonephila clavipes]|nr:hypothetical protein TNCV_66881 [Trichonephila clavipes]
MLVHIDHATRYVASTPSASLGAHSVTDALYHNIILKYGPPIGAVCYEIKSRALQNKFIKIVHLCPYFKRDADVMQNNTSDEENDYLQKIRIQQKIINRRFICFLDMSPVFPVNFTLGAL